MDLPSLAIISVLVCLNAFQVHSDEVSAAEENNNLTLPYQIEPLPDSYAHLGEGPHWNIETQSLYYVSLDSGWILRYDYHEDTVYRSKVENLQFTSFIVPVEGQKDKFVVGSSRRVLVITWDGVSSTSKVDRVLFEVQQDEQYIVNRFNDGKADPRGRLFAGTMRYIGDAYKDRWGELYKYDNGTVTVVKTDVGISNGLAWNEKTNKFYFIDTTDYEVKEYDYDLEAGEATKPKVVFDVRRPNPENNLLPDGMTIDSDGNIYVATYNGYTLNKVNPRGSSLRNQVSLQANHICRLGWSQSRYLVCNNISRI
ncbi:PREDICTED: putative sugar lactone lactonase YvrE isoform X2 [Bactrocera latifrons]|uniref:putative sugar lactone lactonase YvrE isoform X2 n=1 Tax=Bactrocera latifrons TaxID=174628 RepID=UPI0008DD37EB|nr:PREDICTED: putative sugar lactone lactonase YvrE isoform X2 [Bactrocera latifrons]